MTAPKAGAWAMCPRACGRRYRTSNPHGICGKCRQADLNPERTRAYYRRKRAEDGFEHSPLLLERGPEHRFDPEVTMDMAHEAMTTSNLGGHRVPAMVEDVEPGCWIGTCDDCGENVCVDPDAFDEDGHPQQAYGKAYTDPCRGEERSHGPALRREPTVTVYVPEPPVPDLDGLASGRGRTWGEPWENGMPLPGRTGR